MPKSALITGITGQDGSYLAELLLSKGYEVHGTLRNTATSSRNHITHIADQIQLHECDLTSSQSVHNLIEQVRPAELYNLAAQSSVGSSWNAAAKTGDVTALGVARILEAIAQIDASTRFFQAGSSEIFGQSAEMPQRETTPLNPTNPYGIAKVYGHLLTSSFRQSRELFACSGILFNHESPRRGLQFVTRKITSTAARIKLGLETELRLGNLDARRDWGFAGDYVEAMWQMLQQETPEDYVLGTGVSVRVGDFVDLAFAELGLDPSDHVVVDPQFYRPVDSQIALADPSKAKRQLGWAPKTDLQQLVAMMVRHDLELARRQAA
ncbi:MAG TPA: GDP-mannose 4,6-dehydratase [Planctomycetaceae bacterium]|nr:GDP-mannose 4,6-dehydratase [Planctomycetaceae bacterium]